MVVDSSNPQTLNHSIQQKKAIFLKRRPLKERIAADKYKSKFVTKPTHLLRPVPWKANQKRTTTGLVRPSSVRTQGKTDATTLTVLTPTSLTETRDAIEAPLMLGDVPILDNRELPENDNELLVPILGARPAPDNNYIPVEQVEPNKKKANSWSTHWRINWTIKIGTYW